MKDSVADATGFVYCFHPIQSVVSGGTSRKRSTPQRPIKSQEDYPRSR